MMMLGSAIAQYVPPPLTTILEDSFTGSTLDTGEWTVITTGASSAVVQNNELLCSGTAATPSNAGVYSATIIPTTGIVTVSVRWKPGTLYINTGGIGPYLAIRPSSPSRDLYYSFPLSGLQLVLSNEVYGGSNGGTTRISLRAGVAAAGQNMTNTTVSYAYAAYYSVKWIINWTASTISVEIDDIVKVNAQSFSYTPSGNHFFELAYANYGVNGETFDDLLITTPA